MKTNPFLPEQKFYVYSAYFDLMKETLVDIPLSGGDKISLPATLTEIIEKCDSRAQPTGTWTLSDGCTRWLIPSEMPKVPPHEEKYYLMYRYKHLGADGKIIAGFVTSNTYTFPQIQVNHAQAVVNGTWTDGTNGRMLWLVSAESLHTPPAIAAAQPAVQKEAPPEPKDEFLEVTRIYWMSVAMNIYERLNSTGKILTQHYLQQAPWNKPPGFGNEAFAQLLGKVVFDTVHGVEHLRELGKRLIAIYSYDMNRSSTSEYLTIPEPPSPVQDPNPTAEEHPKTAEKPWKSKSILPSMIDGILDSYRALTEKGRVEFVARLGNVPWISLLHAKRADNYDSFQRLLNEIHSRSHIDDVISVMEEIESRQGCRVPPSISVAETTEAEALETIRAESQKTSESVDEERLRVAAETTALFNALSGNGRNVVAGYMILLPWIAVSRGGALTGQAFGEFIRGVQFEYVKELRTIVEKVYANPANRCLPLKTVV
jgi:hypothetical protein